jgi:HEAT repeat protein
LETETDADLIVHALRYLKSGNGADALKPVLRFVEHESWQVRAEVAQSLGEIDSDEIEDLDLLAEKGDAVMKLLEDTDGFVVSRAVGALPSRKSPVRSWSRFPNPPIVFHTTTHLLPRRRI